ncbi:MAG: cell envelope integrity protein TolA [Rhodospirillaceae bacterium]
MGAGLLYSLAVHGLVIAILLLLPWPVHDPAPPTETLVIDLVPGAPAGAATRDSETQAVTPTPAIRHTAKRPPEKITDSVAALLRMAQAAHGTAAAGNGQSGAGQSVRGAGGSTLKDFIRAQIERRWQIDVGAPDMVVTLRLVIAADGNVLAAAVLEDPGRDRAKQSVTMAARNAALLSSPLQFPPGLDGAGELTVELNTRDTRR